MQMKKYAKYVSKEGDAITFAKSLTSPITAFTGLHCCVLSLNNLYRQRKQ